jgi:hypothetical protein
MALAIASKSSRRNSVTFADSFLEFTVAVPLFLALVLLSVGVIVGGALVYRRLLVRTTDLSRQVRDLRAKPAATDEPYCHFIYNLSHEVSTPLSLWSRSLKRAVAQNETDFPRG